jgi:hypothetical protein
MWRLYIFPQAKHVSALSDAARHCAQGLSGAAVPSNLFDDPFLGQRGYDGPHLFRQAQDAQGALQVLASEVRTAISPAQA